MKHLEGLSKISEEVIDTFGNLSGEVLNQRPSPEKWSIAENLSHLIQVNESYFPLFKKVKEGTFQAPFIARFGFFSKLFGNMIYNSVSDEGKKKVKTFPAWKPKEGNKSEIIQEFLDHQKELSEEIVSIKPFLEKQTIIHSPVNKLIVYSLDQALDIILAHEWRHLDQAKEALKRLK